MMMMLLLPPHVVVYLFFFAKKKFQFWYRVLQGFYKVRNTILDCCPNYNPASQLQFSNAVCFSFPVQFI